MTLILVIELTLKSLNTLAESRVGSSQLTSGLRWRRIPVAFLVKPKKLPTGRCLALHQPSVGRHLGTFPSYVEVSVPSGWYRSPSVILTPNIIIQLVNGSDAPNTVVETWALIAFLCQSEVLRFTSVFVDVCVIYCSSAEFWIDCFYLGPVSDPPSPPYLLLRLAFALSGCSIALRVQRRCQ
ncbi:hypothetical protein GY45DRAFT_1329120, partial [Cubamyces sp. BRFM 1775]